MREDRDKHQQNLDNRKENTRGPMRISFDQPINHAKGRAHYSRGERHQPGDHNQKQWIQIEVRRKPGLVQSNTSCKGRDR